MRTKYRFGNGIVMSFFIIIFISLIYIGLTSDSNDKTQPKSYDNVK